MSIITTTLMVFVILFAFISLDGLLPTAEYHSGHVVDKHYTAESKRTGTGFGVTGGGQTGVIITTEREPENYLLMVRAENGEIVTVKCEPELYYEKEIGEPVEFVVYKGWFTGMSWGARGRF
jgi:hypothetical protein